MADKLVKVHLVNGGEAWVLVHIEIQGHEDADFARRMYVYNYRIFDRYGRSVASLAILADGRPEWRPSGYGYELWGSRVRLDFPTIKLLDYAGEWDRLEKDGNPFSIVVMANLKSLETKRDARGRLQWKLALVRMLYERGYKKSDILELFRFIDRVMVLPEDLEKDFSRAHEKYEEATKMPYVTSVERLGIKKGIQQGSLLTLRANILSVLEARFGKIPAAIASRVNALENQSKLKRLHKKAVLAPSLGSFQAILNTDS